MIPFVETVWFFTSGKGGVGKSTVVFQLAKELARQQFRVGILDAEVHNPSIAYLAGNFDAPEVGMKIKPNTIDWSKTYFAVDGLFLSLERSMGGNPCNALYQMLFEVEWGVPQQPLNFLLVDIPLALLEHIGQYAGQVILVTTQSELAVLGLQRAIRFLEKHGINPLGVIENMVGYTCPECNYQHSLFQGQEIQEVLTLLGSIPMDVRMANDDPTMQRHFRPVIQNILALNKPSC